MRTGGRAAGGARPLPRWPRTATWRCPASGHARLTEVTAIKKRAEQAKMALDAEVRKQQKLT
ncbi:hypothetical protein, partial [Micromonospora globbae]|uniref:hypothetical protein n=1 Tax=Micromonospora globbae TaxID=1894969 RepID=UPI0034380B13